MSTISTLNVAVRASTDQFESGMRNVSQRTKEAVDETKGFAPHLESTRGAMHALGEVTGASSGEMMGLMHAFEAFTGPVGIAVGLIAAFAMASNKAAEAAKEQAKEQQEINRLLDETGKILGQNPWGEMSEQAQAGIEKLEPKIEELRDKIEAEQNAWFPSASAISADRDKLKSLQDQQNAIMGVRQELKQFDDSMDEIKDKTFAVKISGGDMLPVLNEKAELLRDTLENLAGKEGANESPQFKKLKGELEQTYLQIKSIQDENQRKKDEIASKAAEAQKKINDDIAKQFSESVAAMDKQAKAIEESVKSPLEKYQETLGNLEDLFNAGKLSGDVFEKAAKKALDEYEKTIAKADAKQGGVAKAIDTNLIDVRGLNNNKDVQKIEGPQLQKAVEILQQMNDKLGIQTAVAG